MKDKQITFVLQGPVVEDITKLSIQNIRRLFPNSKIILSTWKKQNLCGISVDRIIENDDPGSTVMAYDKRGNARTTNVNRQIYSTIQGLKAVKTEFAVKMRTDNYLTSSTFISFYSDFSHRDENYALFQQRIVSTDFFAKEVEKGRKIPYFFSDFFHFGLTCDSVSSTHLESSGTF